MQNEHELFRNIASVDEGAGDGLSSVYHLNLSSGSGCMTIYTVFPGVELAFTDLKTSDVLVDEHPRQDIIEFNFCLDGRLEYEMPAGGYCYLGAGDCSILTLDNHYRNATCPLGHFRTITVYLYLTMLASNPLPLLGDEGVSFMEWKQRLSRENQMIYADKKILQLCMDIFRAPNTNRMLHYQLKLLELLLYLQELPEQDRGRKTSLYAPLQVQMIKQVKEYIDDTPGAKHSIEELTKQFGTNRTALQRLFKGIYGIPIAAYMNNSRMNYAAGLLRSNAGSVAEIAALAGYENQSKFASAFRKVYEMSPTEYRREQSISHHIPEKYKT